MADQLVHTGYAGKASYGTTYPIKFYITYSTSTDYANNKSTITLGAKVVVASGATIGSWVDNGSYAGTTSMKFNGAVPSSTKGTYTFGG